MEKKKNKFLSNKTFVIFSILALVIVMIAILAPQICGDVDPTKGNLADSILEPSAELTEAIRSYLSHGVYQE